MIKVGDTVTPKKGSFFYKKGHRWVGVVRGINLWEDTGPPSPENHGNIAIELLTVEKYHLGVGEIEDYSFWGWENELEIVADGAQASE
jgi:hypothetical protein